MRRYYDELKKFETNMKTASESGYTRNIMVRDRKRLFEIYNSLTGKSRRFTAACPKCMIEVLSELAKRYFDHKNGVTTTGEKEPDVKVRQIEDVPAETVSCVAGNFTETETPGESTPECNNEASREPAVIMPIIDLTTEGENSDPGAEPEETDPVFEEVLYTEQEVSDPAALTEPVSEPEPAPEFTETKTGKQRKPRARAPRTVHPVGEHETVINEEESDGGIGK